MDEMGCFELFEGERKKIYDGYFFWFVFIIFGMGK
jgi:hypothetical protein